MSGLPAVTKTIVKRFVVFVIIAIIMTYYGQAHASLFPEIGNKAKGISIFELTIDRLPTHIQVGQLMDVTATVKNSTDGVASLASDVLQAELVILNHFPALGTVVTVEAKACNRSDSYIGRVMYRLQAHECEVCNRYLEGLPNVDGDYDNSIFPHSCITKSYQLRALYPATFRLEFVVVGEYRSSDSGTPAFREASAVAVSNPLVIWRPKSWTWLPFVRR